MKRNRLVAVAALGFVLLLPLAALALTPLPSYEYLRRTFQEADTDRDGQLSREEYVQMWRYDPERGRQQFQRLDTNRDGSISPDEYLAPMRERRRKQRGSP